MNRPAPSVRFFRTPSGQRVAYSVDGDGPPLVCSAWWVSHVESDWESAGFREFFGGLAEHRTVIRYDRIGAGLSDRERDRVELEDEVATLSALIEHLELPRVALFGLACAGPPAIVYATRQPERVSEIVLFGSFIRGGDVGPSKVRDALQALVRAHWGMGSSAIADLFAPGMDADARSAMTRQQIASASPEMSADLLRLTFDMDVTEAAQRVSCPVLVVHRKGDRTIPFTAGRELAASLSEASLRALDGVHHLPWFGDVDAARSAVLDFIGGSKVSSTPSPLADRELRREGDLWVVSFGGAVVRLKHSRGLGDLAVLLSAPGEEIHVGRLWTGLETDVRLAAAGDPVLDDASLQSYRSRLEDIDSLLADAELLGDPAAAERLRAERTELAAELRVAVGAGGKSRSLADPSERARKAVSARIRAAVKKISEVHPGLGEHLKDSIKTGTYCSYADPAAAPWGVR